MHPILEPGPAILAEAGEVIPIHRTVRWTKRTPAGGGRLCRDREQLMDPIREMVLSSPGLKIVSNVAVGFDNIDVERPRSTSHGHHNTPGVWTTRRPISHSRC